MTGDLLDEGHWVGRYVIVRDVDGQMHTLAAGAVAAACETEEGTLLMLQGGRMVHVPK